MSIASRICEPFSVTSLGTKKKVSNASKVEVIKGIFPSTLGFMLSIIFRIGFIINYSISLRTKSKP